VRHAEARRIGARRRRQKSPAHSQKEWLLRVIERPEAIALLDFLEFRLIGLMSRIVGDAVAFIVKTGRGFRRTSARQSEDKTQGGQRDQESHGLLPLF